MMLLQTLLAWVPSGWELLVIMVIALLLFGKRLPEVARNLGRGVVEFKKGLRNAEDEIDQATSYQPPQKPQGQPMSYGQEQTVQQMGQQAGQQMGQQQMAPQQTIASQPGPQQAAPAQPAPAAPQSGEAARS